MHHRIRISCRRDGGIEAVSHLALLVLGGLKAEDDYMPATCGNPAAAVVTRTSLEGNPGLHDHIARHIDTTDDRERPGFALIADAAALLLRHPDEDRRNAFDLRIALDSLIGTAGQVEETGSPLEH